MILVTGATGTVGREVVAQLVAAGHAVRALTRDPSKARFDPKVQIVTGDLLKPETLTQALEGVERAFSLPVGLRVRSRRETSPGLPKKQAPGTWCPCQC